MISLFVFFPIFLRLTRSHIGGFHFVNGGTPNPWGFSTKSSATRKQLDHEEAEGGNLTSQKHGEFLWEWPKIIPICKPWCWYVLVYANLHDWVINCSGKCCCAYSSTMERLGFHGINVMKQRNVGIDGVHILV